MEYGEAVLVKERSGMIIELANENMRKACNDYPTDKGLANAIKRVDSPHSPEDLIKAMNALRAADTPNDLPSSFNYNLLSYDKTERAAIDIKVSGKGGRGKWRMVMRPISDCGDINKKSSIKKVIIETFIENYHRNK